MKMRKLAIVVAIAMMGSLAVTPLVRADDKDGDGVRNDRDQCPNTTGLGEVIFIGSCNTSVLNTVDRVGCSVAQRIADCLATSNSKCVKNLGSRLQSDGLITPQQRRQLFRCS